MPGVADALRAAGVARAVLRLVGRHRVASVVAVVIAVGWLVVGLSEPGTRAERGAKYVGTSIAVAYGTLVVSNLGAVSRIVGATAADGDRDGDSRAGAFDGGDGADAVVHAGDAVRGGAVGGFPGDAGASRGSDGDVSAWAAGSLVRPVTP